MDPQDFAKVLLTLATIAQGSITSTYRTPKHNAIVGGHPESKHMRGLAGDIVLDDKATESLLKHLIDHFGLQLIVESNHYHIQTKTPS